MRKIIISILFFNTIYCSGESCNKERDRDKCENHIIEENKNYSCYKYKEELSEDNENSQYCITYPNNPNLQKDYRNMRLGFIKEMVSFIKEFYNRDYFQAYSKETYEKNETIYLINLNLSESDKEIYNSNNTCWKIL